MKADEQKVAKSGTPNKESGDKVRKKKVREWKATMIQPMILRPGAKRALALSLHSLSLS